MQRDEAIDRQTVDELCAELVVQFPDESLCSKLTHHNDYMDWEFIQNHLNETRGPTHREYNINLFDTWKLNHLNGRVAYASEMAPHYLLMVGIPKNKLYKVLRGGMFPLSSTKAVFGNKGFYFTSCSTKVANQGCQDSWNYERHADQGFYQPNNSDIGYIMFCDVALGKLLHKEDRQKRGIIPERNEQHQRNSLVFRGLYDLAGVESVNVTRPRMNNYQLDIPRAPLFRDRSIQKLSRESNDYLYYNEFYVEDVKQINPRFLARVNYEYFV